MLDRLRPLFPCLLALLPVLWILSPLFLGQFHVGEDGHALLVEYPLFHLLGVSMAAGQVPMWTQQLGLGLPLMSTGDVGAIHPLNLILFRYLEPFHAWQVGLFLSVLTHFGLAYLYLGARHHSRYACALGALGFALGGYSVARLDSLEASQALSMLPLALFFVERALLSGRILDAMLVGAPLALAIVAGSPAIAAVSLVACLLAIFVEGLAAPIQLVPAPSFAGRLDHPWRRAVRHLLILPVAVAVMVLLAAPQLLLTWDLLPLTDRASGVSFAAALQGALPVAGLLHLLDPLMHGNPFKGTYTLPGKLSDTLAYVGLVPLVLGLMAPLTLWQRDRRAILPLVLLGVGLLAALGDLTPLYRLLWEGLPGFHYLNGPAHFLLLVQLGLCMLAAQGLDFFSEKLEHHPHPIGQRFVGVLPWLCLGVTGLELGHHGSSLLSWTDEKVLFEDLASDEAIPKLGYYRLFSLPGMPGQRGVQSAFPGSNDVSGAGQPQAPGATPFKAQRALLWRNSNLIYRKPVLSAQVSLPIRWQRELETLLLRQFTPRSDGGLEVSPSAIPLLKFLGVRVLLSYFSLEQPQLLPLKSVPVPGVARPVQLYGLEDGAPRMYLSRGVRRCTLETVHARIFEEHFGPGWNPCILSDTNEPTPDVSQPMAAFLEPVSRGEAFLEVKTNLLNPGYLVVREAFAPGWVASVGGEEVPIEQVDLVYQAIKVPDGSHVVRLEYQPRGLRLGILLNFLGLASVALTYFIMQLPGRKPELSDDEPSPDRWFSS